MKVAEQVFQDLILLIEKQQLKIGDRLPSERKLIEMLGVSRTSVREALQKMQILGMISSRLGAGNYIEKSIGNNWHDQYIMQPLGLLLESDPLFRFDVQEARVILEGGTAWYAAQRASDADIAKIQEFYDELTYYQQVGDTQNAATADANFHLAIAEASHNLVLIQMMRSVFELLQYNVVLARQKIYTHAYGFEQLHLQHATVLNAIKDQDPQKAREAVGSHIEFVIAQVHAIEDADARIQRASRFKGKVF